MTHTDRSRAPEMRKNLYIKSSAEPDLPISRFKTKERPFKIRFQKKSISSHIRPFFPFRKPSPQQIEILVKRIWLISTTILIILIIELQSLQQLMPGFATLCFLFFIAGYFASTHAIPYFFESVLVLVLILPAILYGFYHVFYAPYFLPCGAALWGWILRRSFSRSWALPDSWKWPLIYWMLLLSLSWPLIFMRECDFAPLSTLKPPFPSANVLQIPLPVGLTVTLSMIATQLIGFGWLDLLYLEFQIKNFSYFKKKLLFPFYIGLLISYLIGYYQSFFDIRFWNRKRWIVRNIVGGGLLDPNFFGLTAVTLGFLIWIVPLPNKRVFRVLQFFLWALSWGAIMISGARLSLLMASILTIVLVFFLFTHHKEGNKRWFLLISVLLVVILASLIGYQHFHGIPRALERMIPSFKAILQGRLHQAAHLLLWDRFLFYKAAVQMLKYTHGLGVGPGSFHILAPDFGLYPNGQPLHVDNAQNWYLHQLTELGLFGLPGWLIWLFFFVRDVFFRRSHTRSLTIILLKTYLLLFGFFSLFIVHTQNMAILLLFWTVVYWLACEVRMASARTPEKSSGPTHLALENFWPLMGVLLFAFLIGLTLVSTTYLRPAERAAKRGWHYMYGFYGMEPHPVLKMFRWTRKRAAETLIVQSPSLTVDYFVAHPNIQHHPVRIQITLNHHRIIDTAIRDHQIHTRIIHLPPGTSSAILRVYVSRTWRPFEYGSKDTRELGVGIHLKGTLPLP